MCNKTVEKLAVKSNVERMLNFMFGMEGNEGAVCNGLLRSQCLGPMPHFVCVTGLEIGASIIQLCR